MANSGSVKISWKAIALIISLLVLSGGVLVGYGQLTQKVEGLESDVAGTVTLAEFNTYSNLMEKRMQRLEDLLMKIEVNTRH